MSRFNWLHLTDLHWGSANQAQFWPNIRDIFFDDLERLHNKSGPWHAVLFTGDFVETGDAREYTRLTETVLVPFWERLRRIGSNPILLGVTGNHDLLRQGELTAAVRVLTKGGLAEIADEFWDKPTSEYRALVRDSFHNFEQWLTGCEYARKPNITHGLLPGDFSITIAPDEGLRIGVVGLNTAFLQLTSGDFREKLACDVRQLHSVCSEDGAHWASRHDVCILMTHHGPDWLDRRSRDSLFTEINPAGRFLIHFFGHMHEEIIRSASFRGSALSRFWQGCSLFSMRLIEERNEIERRHGYSAGTLEWADGIAEIRHWPRRATNDSTGWRFIPDHDGCRLVLNQAKFAR